MKLPKEDDKTKISRKRIRHGQKTSNQVTEMLKMCLEKVCELQEDLRKSDEMQDPQAAGYAACAVETLRFLEAQGLSSDHPMVKTLTERLLKNKDS